MGRAMHCGMANMAERCRHTEKCEVCGENLAKINTIRHFYATYQLEYSSIDKMTKWDRDMFRDYVAFVAGNTENAGEEWR